MSHVFNSLLNLVLSLALQYAEVGKNLTKFCNNVFDFYIKVSSTLRGDYPEETVLSLTKQLNKNADDIRAEHLKEVNISGHSALSALTFSDMIVALRRIKNHSLNLYQALAQEKDLIKDRTPSSSQQTTTL